LIAPTKRVMSLIDASKKMSKSDPSPRSKINLSDSADEIKQKITKAKTDSIMGITWDPQQRPEVANLLQIFSALSGRYLTKTRTKTHASI
jgi:tryptophanyl-tRNA synthetase